MKFAAAFLLLLMMSALAFAGPAEEGRSAPEPLIINGKHYDVTADSLKTKVSDLAFLPSEFPYHRRTGNPGALRLKDIAARRTEFSEAGWEQYQHYVELAKSMLRRPQQEDWRLILDNRTEQFSDDPTGTAIYSTDAEAYQNDGDEVSSGRKCHLSVSFLQKQGETDILITGWKFDPVGPGWPASAIPNGVAALRKEAENGDVKAMLTLGDMYEFAPVTRDHTEARKWYLMAADRGDPLALRRMGDAYREGWGVDKNDSEMVRWYRKAAERGDHFSQNMLGEMYLSGRGGLDRDVVQGYMWHKVGQTEEVGLNRIASRMTPDQISLANQLAADWKPTPAPANTTAP